MSWQGLGASFLALVMLQLGIFVGTAIYNLYFHPLRQYPGSLLWITVPWTRKLALARGRANRETHDLHEKLGPVVRIAPDMLSFTDPAAWKDIYGHGHAELPKAIEKGTGMEERPNILTATPRDHFRFRRAMAPAFSNNAIEAQEPLINVYVDLLVDRLRAIARSSNTVADAAMWYTMTTFDLFADLCYGKSFGSLESGKQHDWAKAISDSKLLVPLMVLPRFGWILIMLLLPAKVRKSLNDHHQQSFDLAMNRINDKDRQERGDFMTFIMRDIKGDQGITDYEICCNSEFIIGAGSETTATALSGITYYLLRNPEAHKRCVAEIRDRFATYEEITFKAVTERLPYLMACIEEGLRLYPPVPTALTRRVLPGPPTIIAGRLVPENVSAFLLK